MGVDVTLKRVSRPGTSPRRRRVVDLDVVLDRSDLFAAICQAGDLPMLSRADPYRSLILTQAEMPQFISEVDSVRRATDGEQEHELLTAILALAERCAADPLTELHLDGD